MGKKYVPIKGTARNIYGQEIAMDITINMDYFDQIASDNGYVKLQPGEVVVNAQNLLSLVDATCKDTCQAYESTQECETCWVELLRRDATAAIDAARKEGE
jgi:hypothetical protein